MNAKEFMKKWGVENPHDLVASATDLQSVFGQVLNHLGSSIKSGSITIHDSDNVQGTALTLIGGILKFPDYREKHLEELCVLLGFEKGKIIANVDEMAEGKKHILALCQDLLCSDWKTRIYL